MKALCGIIPDPKKLLVLGGSIESGRRHKGELMNDYRPLVIAMVFASFSGAGNVATAADRWQEATFPPPNPGRLVFTITEGGNPACASYDGKTCLWGQTMGNIDFARVKPLVCGAAHRQLYGVTGFEDPNHWCNLALRGASAPSPPAPARPQSPPPAPQPRVSGLEGRFDRPMYKNGPARLDICQHLGKYCGQAAADDYCQIMGYERATKFEIEPASPTRVLNFGQECSGTVCRGFKFIVCFTRAAERGKVRNWPAPMDPG